jgi:hypothetical protein
LLAQRKRTKRKGSRSLGPAVQGYPALLKITGRCKTRGVYAPQGCSNSCSAIPVIFPLLGCVTWRKEKTSSNEDFHYFYLHINQAKIY